MSPTDSFLETSKKRPPVSLEIRSRIFLPSPRGASSAGRWPPPRRPPPPPPPGHPPPPPGQPPPPPPGQPPPPPPRPVPPCLCSCPSLSSERRASAKYT